jgi:tripartite-type tricarboxylate transporter receptor subunit TctC
MRILGLGGAWLAVCFVLAMCPGAMAQDYPNRTIKLIVPTRVGGITDILARLVGNSIGNQLGQPVIIDNRTGAGGILGTRAVAQSEPAGYTLLMLEMVKLLTEQGIEPAGNSPEEFAVAMHADIEKWMRVCREAGIKPQ